MGIFRLDKDGTEFDDGINAVPGEPEFTRDLAKANFGTDAFSYVGTPAYENPIEKATLEDFNAKLAEAEAEAADLLAIQKAEADAAAAAVAKADASKCDTCGATIIP